jgi:uncharacterized protein (TIGR02599 family)
MKLRPSNSNARQAFTLIELIAATVVLSMLMLACVTALDTVRRSVSTVRGKAQQFREARQAFELITRTISQATLNTYWDYHYTGTGSNVAPVGVVTPPSAYVRHSELQFQVGKASNLLGAGGSDSKNPGHAIFFQAPLGLTQNPGDLGSLLNARGYSIQFSQDDSGRPPFLSEYTIPTRHRYALVEFRPPAEKTSTFSGNTIYSKPNDWFRQDLDTSVRIVAENIILLVLSPCVSAETASSEGKPIHWIAPKYTYNSLDSDNSTPTVDKVKIIAGGTAEQGTQHLLPPLVNVTMVALDEASAANWSAEYGTTGEDYLSKASAPFTNAASYEADLARLEQWLNEKRLNYEVFSSTIPLRNARWDSRTF